MEIQKDIDKFVLFQRKGLISITVKLPSSDMQIWLKRISDFLLFL